MYSQKYTYIFAKSCISQFNFINYFTSKSSFFTKTSCDRNLRISQESPNYRSVKKSRIPRQTTRPQREASRRSKLLKTPPPKNETNLRKCLSIHVTFLRFFPFFLFHDFSIAIWEPKTTRHPFERRPFESDALSNGAQLQPLFSLTKL